MSRVAGYPHPCRDFRLHKAQEGWVRLEGRHKDNRHPVSPLMLQQLVGALPALYACPFEASLFKAALFIDFFEAFRVNELVTKSKTDPLGHALTIGTFTGMIWGCIIKVRISKTDQLGLGHEVPFAV